MEKLLEKWSQIKSRPVNPGNALQKVIDELEILGALQAEGCEKIPGEWNDVESQIAEREQILARARSATQG